MKKNKTFLLILIFVACCSQFTSDIYVPALLDITTSMHTSIRYIQMSIPVYLFGVASTQLIYGLLSEGLGRKIPLIIGVVLMIIGSFMCLVASTPETLLIGRLLQGFGCGATTSLWRSILRDMYTGKDLSIIGGYLSMVFTFVIPTAPLIGSFLQKYISWQAIFVFLLVYGLITLILVVLFYRNTNPHNHISKLNVGYIYQSYLSIITNKAFMSVTLCSLFMYGAMFAWLTSGSVVAIKYAGVSPTAFGWFNFIGCGLAYGMAGKVNGKLVHRYGVEYVLNCSFKIVFFAGISVLILQAIFGTNFIAVGIAVVVFYFGVSLVWPNAFTLAFSPFGHIAGYAGAMYGCLQIIGGAIFGTLSTSLPHGTFYSVGALMVISAVLSYISFNKFGKGCDRKF